MRSWAIYLKMFPRPNEEKEVKDNFKNYKEWSPSFNIELTTTQQQSWEFASSRWDYGPNLSSFLIYTKLEVGE
jgi:hypothetical protein